MVETKTPTLEDVVSDDLNYELWAPIVKTKLVEKGLWDVVTDGILPDPSKIPELATTVQAEDLSRWRDFVAKDTKALQILQSSIPDSVFRMTLETTSAKELWVLLREASEQAKVANKFEQVKIEVEEERISSSFLDRVMDIADPRVKSSYLAITKMVISLSDSYDGTTEKLRGLRNLTFNRFRKLFDLVESITVDQTLYGILKGSSFDSEGFLTTLTAMSDSDVGEALVMEELKGLQNLTFNGFRKLLDLFELVPMKTINGIMKGFEAGSSSSQLKEVCYSAKDLRDLVKEANEYTKLERKFEQVKMEEEGISSSQSKQDCASVTGQGDSRKVMRSRHERGECIHCGSKGHIFKDCSNRKTQSRKDLPEYQMLAFNIGPVTFDKDMWMIYTTTTNHMTPYVKYFTTLDRTYRAKIRFIAGHSIMSEGMGDVNIMTKDGKKKTIKNVLFVPKIDRNVLSVGQMTQGGYGVVMTAHKCTIKDQTGRLFGDPLGKREGFFCVCRWLKVISPRLTSNQ